jgi:LysM repeat protein
MKWRDWQLLIIFILLFYIAVSLTLIILRQPAAGQEETVIPPTGTLRPTLEKPQASATSTVPPTDTVQPTSTPLLSPTPAATSPPSPTASRSPTALPPPQPTATPTVGTITHTVQRGENLIIIAARYRTTVQAIVQANGLANPDVIYVGQRLIIPLPPPTATPSG